MRRPSMHNRPRVMLVGVFEPGALERSYRSAFAEVGCEVNIFDMGEAVRRNVRLGRFGEQWNRFLPVEPWVSKANREMILAADSFKPDVLVVTGQNPVRPGALAQLRTSQVVTTVLVWPDPMVNLPGPTIQCLPLYDLVATYSRASVPWFQRLGAIDVAWVPLGGDPAMHAPPVGPTSSDLQADVGFIGQWRPERESALALLIAECPELSVRIWGPDWGRRCKGKQSLVAAWQGRSLYHADFAKAVAGCKINLNVIDPTNFPAANMRFFELSVAGGLQVSSACPEMEETFRDRETVAYYRDESELPRVVRELLADDTGRQRIASAARRLVLAEHTYAHRVRALLNRLEIGQE
jgi:spore maturation protein CgeB